MAHQYLEAVPVTELRMSSKGDYYDTRLYVLPGKDSLWRRLSAKAIKEIDDDDDDDGSVEAALIREGKVFHRIASLKVTAFRKYLKISAEDAAKLTTKDDSSATLTVNDDDGGPDDPLKAPF